MPIKRLPFRRAGETLLTLLYPKHCFICEHVAPWGEEICPACRKRLPVISQKRCRKCGKPVETTEVLCDDCKKIPHSFDEGLGLLVYDEVMRNSMAALKYRHRQEYGTAMGHLLYENTKELLEKWRIDVIVPIPVHRKRLRERGYNQAEVLARAFAEKTNLPVRTDLLLRTQETLAMKKLSPKERKANLQHAFFCPYCLKKPINILLIDDIYTTGATIDAASSVLKDSGCGKVLFLSVCIGGGFMVRY